MNYPNLSLNKAIEFFSERNNIFLNKYEDENVNVTRLIRRVKNIFIFLRKLGKNLEKVHMYGYSLNGEFTMEDLCIKVCKI